MTFGAVSASAAAPDALIANGTGPAPLLNVLALRGTNPLYAATSAQQASLAALEQQAVDDTVSDHGLASTDTAAAQTWGRGAAEGELWALLTQAIKTPAGNRTTDQANAVSWLAAVVTRQNVASANSAGLEYTKWAGLGAASYSALLATDPTEAQLQAFLSADPQTYGAGNSHTTPKSTSNEGYCTYVPPSPESDQYQSNLYYNAGQGAPQTCFTPCTNLLGCLPPTPTETDFVNWGTADAGDAYNTAGWTAAANNVAQGYGFAAAVVGAQVSVGLGFSGALASLIGGTSIAEVVAPLDVLLSSGIVSDGAATLAGAQAGVAAGSIGGVAAIILVAIAIGVIQGVNVINAAELPGELAQLIATAPAATPDLAAMIGQPSSTTELFSLFIGATLTEPNLTICDNSALIVVSGGAQLNNPAPCLNAPPVVAASSNDPTFRITKEGSGTTTTSSTLDWTDQAQQTTNSAYVSGNWWVDNEASPAASFKLQLLDVHYTDWTGHEQLAWLADNPTTGYEFITGQPGVASSIDSTTCLSAGTCAASSSIEYVGTDGVHATATLAGLGIPPVSTCSSVCVSTNTTLTNMPTTPVVGEAVTLTSTTGNGCVATSTSGCTATTGTVAFVMDQNGLDITLCPAVPVVLATGTATCTWTPISVGNTTFYATYSPPDANSGIDGSQGKLTLTTAAVSVPSSPTKPVATPGAGSAVVTFTAPVSDGGSPITRYTVTAVDHTNSAHGGQTATGTTSPITVTGLANGDHYSFSVTATNSLGTGPASLDTDPVTTETTPGAPTVGVATPGAGSAVVTFTAPVSDGGSPIISYTVTATDQTNSANGGQSAANGTGPIAVTGLRNGDFYSFTVTATNSLGTGPASSFTRPVLVAGKPGAPTVGVATPGAGSAVVTFTAPVSDGGSPITRYTVTAVDHTNSAHGGQTATGTMSPISVGGLTNRDSYFFTVTAANALGTGPASAASKTVIPLAPLTLATVSLPNATLGIAYSAAVTVTGGSTPYTFSVVNGSLPSGITLNASTGVLTGTSVLVVTASFTIKVADAKTPAGVVTEALALTVAGYTHTVTGKHKGPLTVGAGITYIDGATITGALNVTAGATVAIRRSHIEGPVRSTGAIALSMCGTDIVGPVRIDASTGIVVIGDAGTPGCAGNTILGPVTLSGNHKGLHLGNNTILGPVSITNNVSSTPTSAIGVDANRITGSLVCSGNTPPPSDADQPNTVVGSARGQCSTLKKT